MNIERIKYERGQYKLRREAKRNQERTIKNGQIGNIRPEIEMFYADILDFPKYCRELGISSKENRHRILTEDSFDFETTLFGIEIVGKNGINIYGRFGSSSSKKSNEPIDMLTKAIMENGGEPILSLTRDALEIYLITGRSIELTYQDEKQGMINKSKYLLN